MSNKRDPKSLRIEALESRALPASLALSIVLDASCDGDPVEWAALHRELTDVACEQIDYWAQPRASDQILELFHQQVNARPDVAAAQHDLPRASAKTAEYCGAIDELIGEAAAGEIIRCLDTEATSRQLGEDYAELVDAALQQLPAQSGDLQGGEGRA